MHIDNHLQISSKITIDLNRVYRAYFQQYTVIKLVMHNYKKKQIFVVICRMYHILRNEFTGYFHDES